MEEIKGLKFFVEGDTTPPKREVGSAGIDLFVPNISEQFLKDLAEKNPGTPFRWGVVGAPTEENKNKGVYISLPQHEDILIPTYIKAKIPPNVFLHMDNKSGVCTNQKLVVGASVIDPDYTGIIHVHVFNNSNVLRFIEFGQKIAQMVPIIFDASTIELYYNESVEQFKEFKNLTTLEKFYEGFETKRGEKGFGSSGLKE